MRKHLGKMLIFAALTAALLTVTAFAAETGTVNVDALRLRSEPSTDSSTVTYLNNGTQVDILEDLGDWYHISVNGESGYVSAEYITFKSAGSVTYSIAPESVAGQTGVITGELVNFRGGPSTDDEILTTLTGGTEISLISVEGEWSGKSLHPERPASANAKSAASRICFMRYGFMFPIFSSVSLV